jgi:hypothetical protein
LALDHVYGETLMADLSDVEKALVSTIASALFSSTYQPGAAQASLAMAPWPPAGPGQTPAAPVPVTVRLYRGWPETATLEADLAAGKAHVSVFPMDGVTRDTSRFWPRPVQTASIPATVTATVSGSTVTIGGSITAGNVVGIQIGPARNPQAYAYVVQASDTLASVAAALGAKITGATVSGAVITLPSALNLTAGSFALQPALTEVRRQMQGFRVSAWCPTPAARDAICKLIDCGLAGLRDSHGNLTRFLVLPDNSTAWIKYTHTGPNDYPARDRVWRRDLCYGLEYPSTILEQDPTMLFGGGQLTVTNSGQVIDFGASSPS